MRYFIVTSTEDGIDINSVSEEELLKRITPDEDGETYYGEDLEFFATLPEIDKGCWWNDDPSVNKLLIIKGEIVVPKKKQVATKYEI